MSPKLNSLFGTLKQRITMVVVDSPYFRGGVMVLILCNAITLCFEADVYFRQAHPRVFEITNAIFYGFYLVEFCAKVCAMGTSYWFDIYNDLDALVLVGFATQNLITFSGQRNVGVTNDQLAKISGGIRVLKTLRTLRLITYVKELEVLMKALIDSLAKFVIYILVFIFLIIFLFALLGYYLFGYMVNKEGYWKNLWESLLSILTYVTAEGWRDVQAELDLKYEGSGRAFSVIALIVGNFILMNVFVGIIVMNISDALKSFKDEKMVIMEKAKERKKEILLAKYQKDITKIQETMEVKDKNFHENLVEFYQTLAHNETVVMFDITTSLMWMETFTKTLSHQENTLWRITQLLNEMMNALIDETERRQEIRQSFKSLKGKQGKKGRKN